MVWLRSLGLGKYEAAFRENEIDERVLPNLTQEDLKEIGVGPVGHRRILLEAIAALRCDASFRDGSTTAGIDCRARRGSRWRASAYNSHVLRPCGINQHLCGARRGGLADLVGAYLDAASAAVTEMGGHVAKSVRLSGGAGQRR